MTILIVLVVAHFVGDFLLQQDWMAVNKSKSWLALTAHVLAYGGCLTVTVGLLGSIGVLSVDLLAIWFLAVNHVAHFVTDAITSRITARLWFIDGARVKGRSLVNIFAYIGAIGTISVDEAVKAVDDELRQGGNGLEVVYNDNRHWFFVAIGADQLIHFITLFVTAGWWLR